MSTTEAKPKLTELTPEQQEQLEAKKQFWLQKFTHAQTRLKLNKDAAREHLLWLYKEAGLGEDVDILFVSSPMGAQILANAIMEHFNEHGEGCYFDDSQENIDRIVAEGLKDIPKDMTFYDFGYYVSVSDYGWVSFYDFFSELGIVEHEKFEKYKDLLDTGIYDTIQYKGLCIVCEQPEDLFLNNIGLMHNTDGPAVKWRDGFKMYYINGRLTPEWIIEEKEKITRERYLKETDAEHKAAMVASIGQENFAKLFGAEAVDVCKDNNETLTLWRSREKDPTLNEHLQWVECECPSTSTRFFLGVGPEHVKAKEAMASLWEGMSADDYVIEQHT